MSGWVQGTTPCNNLPGYIVVLMLVLQCPDVVSECLNCGCMPKAVRVSVMSLLEGVLSQAGVVLLASIVVTSAW